MKKAVKAILTMMLAASLIMVLGSCGKAEPVEISGTLTNAVDGQISIRTDDGPKVFKTADDTVYNLGEESELTVGDVIKVRYHKSLGKDHVDEVSVVEHFKPTLIFEGTVAGLKEGNITVTGKSLTVAFTRDDDTAVRGELKVGAEVEVTYDGDLSEFPYATDVKVTRKAADAETNKEEKKGSEEDKKKEEVKTATVSGIVSEFTEKSMLLAIDSATSYRFTLGKDFKVTGADKYVHTGDSVNVTFTGKLGKSAEVVEINIVKKAQEEKKTVNGTISSIEKDYLTLNTGKKSYIICIDKNTKYTGDKPAKGRKAEITYTGNLSRDALATNVYCVKVSPEKKVIFKVTFTDGTGNIISTQTVEKGKAAKAPKNPAREGYTFKGWDKDFSKVTSDLTVSAVWKKKAEPKPEPEEEEVSFQGVIIKWTSDGDDSFTVKQENGPKITFTAGDFTEIASGYFPAVNDTIKVTYLESDLKAKKIELIEKAPAEDEDKDDQGDEPAPSPKPEDETVEPEPAPAPEEETVEPEPAPAPEEETVEPEPEPEPKEDPDVVVASEGTILEVNESKGVIKIKTDDGEKLTLDFDSDCDISSGYFPEKDDVVSIKYTKKGMALKVLKLIDRPEPPAPEESEPSE